MIIDEQDIKKKRKKGAAGWVSESTGTPSEGVVMKSLFYPGGSSWPRRRSRVRSSCHFDP